VVRQVYMTDNAYEKGEIIAMEGEMLSTLSYALGNPLPTQFLQRYAKAVEASDMTVAIANYVMELSTVSYEMVAYKPSTLAATALVVASQITAQECCPKALEYYSTYSMDQLSPCMRQLQCVLKQAPESKLRATIKKFKKEKYQLISQREDVNKYILSL
jgi:cyclin B